MEHTDTIKLKITVGINVFTATLYNNPTVTAFKVKLPISGNLSQSATISASSISMNIKISL